MYLWKVLLFILSLSFSFSAYAQTDSTVIVIDSTLLNPDAKRNPVFNAPKDTAARITASKPAGPFKDSARLALEKLPRTAIRRSAIVPGWGQVTNKRWWKVPIIYGGFVGFGLMFDFYQKLYKQHLSEEQFRYRYMVAEQQFRQSKPPPTNQELEDFRKNNPSKNDKELERYDSEALRFFREGYRRNRDLSVLGVVALYAINLIDAYVDAKFFRFDISDELGVKITPSTVPSGTGSFAFAPAIKIKLNL
jgi:hypothetical protein